MKNRYPAAKKCLEEVAVVAESAVVKLKRKPRQYWLIASEIHDKNQTVPVIKEDDNRLNQTQK